jgi:hypothetical protein
MREMGVRGALIYCADYRCSHSIALSADQWLDDLRLSDIEFGLSARSAASAALTCGLISTLHLEGPARCGPVAARPRATKPSLPVVRSGKIATPCEIIKDIQQNKSPALSWVPAAI